MTSKNEFNDAKKILQKEVSGTADSVWSSRNQFLRQFNRTDGWTLLNELLQNAVDEGAKNVEISLDDDSETLEFRHDADPDKSKLETDEIICATENCSEIDFGSVKKYIQVSQHLASLNLDETFTVHNIDAIGVWGAYQPYVSHTYTLATLATLDWKVLSVCVDIYYINTRTHWLGHWR